MRRKPSNQVEPALTSIEWEPVKLVLQETGGWIKNADTKSTIIAGAFGVSLTFVVPRIVTASTYVFTGVCQFTQAWWIALLLLVAASIAFTAWNLYRTLIPRTNSEPANRFSWPSLATEFATPPAPAGPEITIQEAWQQTLTLARIAQLKFKHLRRALRSFGVYLFLLLVFTIASVVLGVG